MASSSHVKELTTYATDNNPIAFKLIAKEVINRIPQPTSSYEAVMKNWQLQTLILFVVDRKLLAFHGPLADQKSSSKAVAAFFPGYKPAAPLAFDKSVTLDVRFMEVKARVLRFMPTPGNKEYLAWLKKVQQKRQDQWQSAGIYDLIQISRYAHRVNPCMLLGSLYFWEGSTNTFQLPYEMLTPTLFDVAVITSFSSLGEVFDPTLSTENTFSFSWASLQNYIEDHYNKDSVEVSHKEHIAFLTLWISYYVLCPCSLQIAKSYIALEIQIHEGRQVSLGKLLLASLYQALGMAALKLKFLSNTPKALNMSGPLWILQHWLNATFEYQLGYPVSDRIMRLTEDRQIEGARFTLTTWQETPNTHLFMKYLNMFIEVDKFAIGISLFVDRPFGPKWFKDPFPGGSPQAAAESNTIWKAFLNPTLLSYRIKPGSKGFGFMSYQPNMVARQFGLSQMVSKPMVSHETDIIWFGQTLTVDDHKACLRFCKSTHRYELLVFKFHNLF